MTNDHFEGVDPAFHLWVNDEMVSYNRGSPLPAEFNITSYFVYPFRKNKPAVQAYC